MQRVLLCPKKSPGKGLSAEQDDVLRKKHFAVSLCRNQSVH